jgi:hypothetical protein
MQNDSKMTASEANSEVSNSTSLKMAMKTLKRARRRIREIKESRLSSREKVRRALAEAVCLAKKIRHKHSFKTALRQLARKLEIEQRRTYGSEHLLLLRCLRLDPKTGSTTRFAQTIEALLARNWSCKKMRKKLLKYGPTSFIRGRGDDR